MRKKLWNLGKEYFENLTTDEKPCKRILESYVIIAKTRYLHSARERHAGLRMKKVSVILPCYNGARWISRAIESVLAQTWGHFELVIIDDGSTDNSKKIILPYLSDERVQYIYQDNRGFSAAINRGVAESRGCLICFIGQDDLWMPNKLELQT